MSKADSDAAKTASDPARKHKSTGREFVTTVLFAVLIALTFRTFAYEPFSIPSESMLPNLLVGDYLLVSKFSYGYSKHSFPGSLGPFDGRIFEKPVTRGDVAVFKFPLDNRTDYIKRLVGLPGDEIQVRDGALYINGAAVKRERIADFEHPDEDKTYRQYRETLPNGVSYLILDCYADAPETSRCLSPLDNTPVFKVPPGHYFAMGDNRDNSQDGRAFGFVPVENLVGRADIIFFSTCGGGCDAPLWKPWNWFGAIRYDRFFDVIQ